MTHTLRFKVTGGEKIHCAGCEERIAKALARVPGIAKAQADAGTQKIAVSFDSLRISPEQVRTRIEQLGYQVTPHR